MKKNIFILVLLSMIVGLLSSCSKDTVNPSIYLLDSKKNTIAEDKADTVVLLYTKYVDPGVYVEDNVSLSSAITVTDNIKDVLPVTKDGYLRMTKEAEIIYTATDEAGNVSTKKRKIRVANPSEVFAGTYTLTRSTATAHFETITYRSTIAPDVRTPGRIRFNNACIHLEGGKKIYYKVGADLLKASQINMVPSAAIAYMGSDHDKEMPFYNGFLAEQAFTQIKDYTYLLVDAQTYSGETDSETGLESAKIRIAGIVNSETGLPESKIEYIQGTKIVKQIILVLNVSKEGTWSDRVTEVYRPF